MLIEQKKEMTESEHIVADNSNNQYLQALSYVAVGTIYPFAGTIAPDTFMICDGSSLDVTEYSELFAIIGYTFGGSGYTFKIPDLRGKTLVGMQSGDENFGVLGKTGGEAAHKLTSQEMPAHTHRIIKAFGTTELDASDQPQWAVKLLANALSNVQNNPTTGATAGIGYSGGNGAHNNLQPYTVVNYIIKVVRGIPEPLEKDTEFVFLGGDAEGVAKIDLVVEDELSETSENPVQNKVIAQRFGTIEASLQADRKIIDLNTENISVLSGEVSASVLASHPVGSLYWSSDSTDPSELLGGTWELVDKEFAPKELYNIGLTINTDTVASGSVNAQLAGHTVEITVRMVNAIEIGDDNNTHWGDLDPNAFGCSEFSQTLNLLSVNDGGNGCVMFAVNNAGVITSGDTIGSRPITTAGSPNSFTAIFTQMPHLMLDDYCSKFCWKRIA